MEAGGSSNLEIWDIDTIRREFEQNGRLVEDDENNSEASKTNSASDDGFTCPTEQITRNWPGMMKVETTIKQMIKHTTPKVLKPHELRYCPIDPTFLSNLRSSSKNQKPTEEFCSFTYTDELGEQRTCEYSGPKSLLVEQENLAASMKKWFYIQGFLPAQENLESGINSKRVEQQTSGAQEYSQLHDKNGNTSKIHELCRTMCTSNDKNESNTENGRKEEYVDHLTADMAQGVATDPNIWEKLAEERNITNMARLIPTVMKEIFPASDNKEAEEEIIGNNWNKEVNHNLETNEEDLKDDNFLREIRETSTPFPETNNDHNNLNEANRRNISTSWNENMFKNIWVSEIPMNHDQSFDVSEHFSENLRKSPTQNIGTTNLWDISRGRNQRFLNISELVYRDHLMELEAVSRHRLNNQLPNLVQSISSSEESSLTIENTEQTSCSSRESSESSSSNGNGPAFENYPERNQKLRSKKRISNVLPPRFKSKGRRDASYYPSQATQTGEVNHLTHHTMDFNQITSIPPIGNTNGSNENINNTSLPRQPVAPGFVHPNNANQNNNLTYKPIPLNFDYNQTTVVPPNNVNINNNQPMPLNIDCKQTTSTVPHPMGYTEQPPGKENINNNLPHQPIPLNFDNNQTTVVTPNNVNINNNQPMPLNIDCKQTTSTVPHPMGYTEQPPGKENINNNLPHQPIPLNFDNNQTTVVTPNNVNINNNQPMPLNLDLKQTTPTVPHPMGYTEQPPRNENINNNFPHQPIPLNFDNNKTTGVVPNNVIINNNQPMPLNLDIKQTTPTAPHPMGYTEQPFRNDNINNNLPHQPIPLNFDNKRTSIVPRRVFIKRLPNYDNINNNKPPESKTYSETSYYRIPPRQNATNIISESNSSLSQESGDVFRQIPIHNIPIQNPINRSSISGTGSSNQVFVADSGPSESNLRVSPSWLPEGAVNYANRPTNRSSTASTSSSQQGAVGSQEPQNRVPSASAVQRKNQEILHFMQILGTANPIHTPRGRSGSNRPNTPGVYAGNNPDIELHNSYVENQNRFNSSIADVNNNSEQRNANQINHQMPLNQPGVNPTVNIQVSFTDAALPEEPQQLMNLQNVFTVTYPMQEGTTSRSNPEDNLPRTRRSPFMNSAAPANTFRQQNRYDPPPYPTGTTYNPWYHNMEQMPEQVPQTGTIPTRLQEYARRLNDVSYQPWRVAPVVIPTYPNRREQFGPPHVNAIEELGEIINFQPLADLSPVYFRRTSENPMRDNRLPYTAGLRSGQNFNGVYPARDFQAPLRSETERNVPGGATASYTGPRPQPNICTFCLKNGEVDIVYKSHTVKDANGNVICPVLRNYVCRYCGATGNSAHTDKYCPYNPRNYLFN